MKNLSKLEPIVENVVTKRLRKTLDICAKRNMLTLIFGAFYWPATSAVNTMTVLQALWTVLGCACVGALAFCVGFFFLTHGMLRKHLNLQ